MNASDAIILLPPTGRWAVGVSGGADSVALLELLRTRGDLQLVVAHLDHETRSGGSAADAEFVRRWSAQWSLPCVTGRRSEIEADMPALPRNRSARFRAARLQHFRNVVERNQLDGVLLAHHADDQAETVLQRLLRGSGPSGLMGMRADTRVSGVRIIRPLLGVRGEALREMLRCRGIGWRDDPGNRSPGQQRNRVRALLAGHPGLHDAAINLAVGSSSLVQWLGAVTPRLGDSFDASELRCLPHPIAREAARQWLAAEVGGAAEVPAEAAERLLTMACDAAAPARQHFPGGILVRRRRGRITVNGCR